VHVRSAHSARRGAAVAAVGCALACLVLTGSAPASAPVLAVEVTAATTGRAMPAGFVGLSFEYHALDAYAGRDPRAVNPVFAALVRALAPGQSPVLRIGGNSTDQTWWPMPGMIAPGGITYSLTDDWLGVARALAIRLHARLILGINLAADSPALAAAEGRALVAGIGATRIAALEIGNEPDVYTQFAWYRDRLGDVVFARPPSYDFADFLADFSRWRAALPRGVPVAGPAFASLTWMAQLHQFLAAEPHIGEVTVHRYPLRGCETDPTLGDYPSLANLLSDAAAAGLAQSLAPSVALAHAGGVRLRVDELNSAACTGKRGVSNTFASALWVLDTLFNLAAVGVDGVNIHTLPGAPYEPFAFSHRRSRWSAQVRPIYYGMLMFARAFPPGARLLQVDAPAGPVKVWATVTSSGTVRVVLINKDPTAAVDVHLSLPGAEPALAGQSLSAPSLTATTGVRLGGETFGARTRTGVLPLGKHLPLLEPVGGYYSVALPPGSAVLLVPQA
jgi:hypothetical protein